jgi:hypothetical protein
MSGTPSNQQTQQTQQPSNCALPRSRFHAIKVLRMLNSVSPPPSSPVRQPSTQSYPAPFLNLPSLRVSRPPKSETRFSAPKTSRHVVMPSSTLAARLPRHPKFRNHAQKCTICTICTTLRLPRKTNPPPKPVVMSSCRHMSSPSPGQNQNEPTPKNPRASPHNTHVDYCDKQVL